ncbi:hypothetical protein [uncultured Alsobacter sp.]|uniref:hypothetical protein n=1 Tax=uncultured Alsobacter sp. TaxID=1748258 RepID=UPI0025EB2344|nr:hypothetical protein [uncultured Alsobacter sp.]
MLRSLIPACSGAVAFAAWLAASSAPALAAGGCDGLSLSVQATGGESAWSLEVPFDSGFATLSNGPNGGRSVILNETCTVRRVAFDLIPARDTVGGRCVLILEGSDASGGCVIDGVDRAVTGLIRHGKGDGGAGGGEALETP